jgi:chromosome segregation ATPase
MFSIFKKNKRNRAEILLLSELVATTRSELRTYQREVHELQQQINDLETEAEEFVKRGCYQSDIADAIREYCEDYVYESTYEENRDQTDERLDVLEANVMFKEQAKHELAKLSAMLFLLVTKEGYDFEEFEKESQPIYKIFVKDAE